MQVTKHSVKLRKDHPGSSCSNCEKHTGGGKVVYLPRVIVVKGKHKDLRTSLWLCSACKDVDITTIKNGRYILDKEQGV